MKIGISILCGLFLWMTPIFSQVKMGKEWQKHQEFYNKTFGENDPDFAITKSPAIFKEEPVVVLSQKLYLGFFNIPNSRNKRAKLNVKAPNAIGLVKGIVHKRVLIQQESAIADFSEYYFGQSEVMGMQLIKADGRKQKIDLEKAIPVTTAVPKLYRSNFQNTKYYKIAISNLEVGDILDFYTIFQEDHLNNSSSFVMTLSSTYPIAYSKILFDFDEKWNFYYQSINGANEFEEIASGGVNLKGDLSDKARRFVVVGKDIPSQGLERWDYPYLNEPTIKMMTFKSAMFGGKFSATASFKKIPAPENRIKPYKDYYTDYNNTFYPIKNKHNKIFDKWKSLPKAQRVEQVYHYLRYHILPKKGLDLAHLKETSEQDNYVGMSDRFFEINFRNALDDLGISSQLVYAVPEYYGALDKAVALEERVIGVYVEATGKYYFAPNSYSKPGEIPTYLNNAAVLRIPFETTNKHSFNPNSPSKPNKNTLFSGVLLDETSLFDMAEKVRLPQYQSTDNLFAAKLELDLSDDLMEQSGVLKLTLNNRYRRSYSNMFLNNLTYQKEDAATFNLAQKAKKKKKAEIAAEKKAAITNKERDRLRLNAIKTHFQADYSIKDLTDFKVINDGRYGDNPLVVQLDFTAENLVKKAGKNYIFSAGSLIGEQVELDKAEIEERTKNIYFGAAKYITNDIKVNIPNTFKVEGLDNLKFTIDNDYMTFISTAKMVNNTLVITTKKDYKKARVSKLDWAAVVAVLEGAYEFTQAKVVLKAQDEQPTPSLKEK